MKSWLEDNDIEINAKHNERKSAVAERFFRALKVWIYDCNIKKVHIDKFDDTKSISLMSKLEIKCGSAGREKKQCYFSNGNLYFQQNKTK